MTHVAGSPNTYNPHDLRARVVLYACVHDAADPANVPAVRHTLGTLLTEWGLPETAPTAQLVLSELLGNAIRYGEGPTVTVDVTRTPTGLRIAIGDDCHTARPRLRHPSDEEEHGRGLALVDALTTDWGTRPRPPANRYGRS